MQKTLLEILNGKKLHRILLTHHHEDHSGNASAIRRHHHIEAFGHPLTVQKMADNFRILPYQHLVWGRSEPLVLQPLGSTIESNSCQLAPIHTPGHSKDHTVYWEKARGSLFAGDLYLGQRIKFFRSDEKIIDQIESLKNVLKLNFDTLFCAHNPCLQNGKSKLRQKLQFLEDIVGQVQQLKNMGLNLNEIFKRLDSGKDKWIKLMTMGNVSYANMLRSAYQLDRS
jgi:glyoxylase-like metal-dependent hydrolase (beta-lactamase superfamily II)